MTKYLDIGDARVAYEREGAGQPVLFVHGWPFSRLTWRKLVPLLAPRFECIRLDLPGLGETEWSDACDLSTSGQADTLARFLDALGIDGCRIVATDTGATSARVVAANRPELVAKLALFNTEMPGHRPPWIRPYQKLLVMPGAAAMLRALLRSRTFVHSTIGFGGCFEDRALLDEEDFRRATFEPLLARARGIAGAIRYLRGIDWKVVDRLPEIHAAIRAPTLFIWGAQDRTFPLARAQAMASQMATCKGLVPIDGARLLVHEEKPREVAEQLLGFL
jgi:pimeloyl-ACP methyl ester carboxylesterase